MTAQKYWYLLQYWEAYLGRVASPEKQLQWDNVLGGYVNAQTIEEAPKTYWQNGGANQFYTTVRDYFGKYSRHPAYPDQCPYSYLPVNNATLGIPSIAIDPRGTYTSEIVWTAEERDPFPANWFTGETIAVPLTKFDFANPPDGVSPYSGTVNFYRNTIKDTDQFGDALVSTLAVRLPDYLQNLSGYVPDAKENSGIYHEGYVRDTNWVYIDRRTRGTGIYLGNVVDVEENPANADEALVYVDLARGLNISFVNKEDPSAPSVATVIRDGGDDQVFLSILNFSAFQGAISVPKRGDGVFDRTTSVQYAEGNLLVFSYLTAPVSRFRAGAEVYLNIFYDKLLGANGSEILDGTMLYKDAPKATYAISQQFVYNEADKFDSDTIYQEEYADPFVDDYPFDEDIDQREPYTGLGDTTSVVFKSGPLYLHSEIAQHYGALKTDYYAPEPETVSVTECVSSPYAYYEILNGATFDAAAYVSDSRYTTEKDFRQVLEAGWRTLECVGLVGKKGIYYHNCQDVFVDHAITEDNLIYRVVLRDLSGRAITPVKGFLGGVTLSGPYVFTDTKVVKYDVDTFQPVYEVPYPGSVDFIDNDGEAIYADGELYDFLDTYFDLQETINEYNGVFSILGPLIPDSEKTPTQLSDGAVVGALHMAAYPDRVTPHFTHFIRAGGLDAFDRIVMDEFDGSPDSDAVRTVVAGFASGEWFQYLRPSKAYYEAVDSDTGNIKVFFENIPASNSTVTKKIGAPLPEGDFREYTITTDEDGDETLDRLTVPFEHAVAGAYLESPLDTLTYITRQKLPLTAGYLVNGYRSLHVSITTLWSNSDYTSNPIFNEYQNRFTLSLCVVGDTHALVHHGGRITEAVSLTGRGTILLDGITGATYTAHTPGVDLVAVKDDYHEVVVYIGIFNTNGTVITLVDNEQGDTFNFTPAYLYAGEGQTAGDRLGTIHTDSKFLGTFIYTSQFTITHTGGALERVIDEEAEDGRTLPAISGLGTSGYDGPAPTEGVIRFGTAEASREGGFEYVDGVFDEVLRLTTIKCRLDTSNYESDRTITITVTPFAANVDVLVGYQPDTKTGVNAVIYFSNSVKHKAIKRVEGGYIVDLSTSLYDIPLGKRLAVGIVDTITDDVATWFNIAEALPPLGTEVDPETPDGDISTDSVGAGQEGPVLL